MSVWLRGEVQELLRKDGLIQRINQELKKSEKTSSC